MFLRKVALQKQKQPPRGVPRKSCSENMLQIYRRTPISKYDFNKVAKQLYQNRTSAWVFSRFSFGSVMFSLRFSGRKFLINPRRQFRVRKIFYTEVFADLLSFHFVIKITISKMRNLCSRLFFY